MNLIVSDDVRHIDVYGPAKKSNFCLGVLVHLVEEELLSLVVHLALGVRISDACGRGELECDCLVFNEVVECIR